MKTTIPEITVKDKNLKFQPNLADYESAYKNFNLDKLVKENIDFFAQNKINAAYNAIDRQVLTLRKNKIAIYHLDENLNETKLTFFELNQLSNRFGNLLKSLGVDRGDRVFFFLPRIPELFYGFLGTLKIGAVAGTMFSAFGVQALIDRLGDSRAKVVVTNLDLLPRVKEAKKHLPDLKKILVVEKFKPELSKFSAAIHVAHMDPDDPAFMLYTSGTTGNPKGIVHAHRAIIQEHLTAKWVLDLKEEDTYWCTADPGWVTGIAYEILGSLSNGAATVIYEGRFDPSVWYKIIEKHRVSVWYTAPTAIRMLQAAGKNAIGSTDLSSLRHILSVGEPLNPEPLIWGFKTYGLPFHDTWWQTETGGIMLANFAALSIKPGSMGKPIPGIVAGIVDDSGRTVKPMVEGNLAIRKGWPAMMKTVWRRPKKFQSYFIGDWFISGDRAYQDRDGYFWFVGRADDVIKTAGERVGPFEVESALVAYPGVTEAGVIGKPDPLRGQIIKAFVTLNPGVKPAKDLVIKLQEFVKKNLAGHAYPREIEFVKSLPKTKSGKIMRRMLRAKELGLPIGDTSTLEEY